MLGLLHIMTFVEIHANEAEPEIEKLVTDAYASTYHEAAPVVRLGKTIRWDGRMFRELCLPSGSMTLQHEDMIFHAAMMPHDRARIKIGSIQGEVFTTPPTSGGDVAARFIDCGRCRPETTIRPFYYSAYDPEA